MELMDTSLDKFYKFIYEVLKRRIPEPIIAKITVATVKALNYLKEKLKIIHRYIIIHILYEYFNIFKLSTFFIFLQRCKTI